MTATPVSPPSAPKRRWSAPEVIQSSAMDCGPAALKCLLEGFGIPVSYGRLREACQTDVDGTSIDSLEEVAVRLGLRAEQIMIPVDHLLLPSARAQPGIVVVHLPNGITHFVVLWRRVAGWVQVMDPGSGRHWQRQTRFLDHCYLHEHRVPAAAWKAWASTEEFTDPLVDRLGKVGVPAARARSLLQEALDAEGWRELACLDAAIRLLQDLIDARAIKTSEGEKVLPGLAAAALEGGFEAIPRQYWSAMEPDRAEDAVTSDEPGEDILLRGVVLVRAQGLADPPAERTSPPRSDGSRSDDSRSDDSRSDDSRSDDSWSDDSRSDESADGESGDVPGGDLAGVLGEETPSPWRSLAARLRRGGLGLPLALGLGSLGAAMAVLLEALVLRSFLEMGPLLGAPLERWQAVALFVTLAAFLLALRQPILHGIYRLGRELEVRLRLELLQKITRLPHRYFASRLVSDMAERAHSVHRLRSAPQVAESLVRTSFLWLFTTLGILWLDPGSWPFTLAASVSALFLPLAVYPFLAERDLKARSHAGALHRFYLDALLGLTTIRSHGAERSVRREHEALLREWRRAAEGLLAVSVPAQGLQTLVGFGLAAALLADHLGRAGLGGGALLLVYWALRLPQLGEEFFTSVRSLPTLRSISLRLLEPLTAPDDGPLPEAVPKERFSGRAHGIAVAFDDVDVVAGGHHILRGVRGTLEPGEHVAVVGPSGAGKSTLVGLLLGHHRTAAGTLLADGLPLTPDVLEALRRETAWVDPAVQLWNRSLFDNLRYGLDPVEPRTPLGEVATAADLGGVIERLPEGMTTSLGEGGGLVSGGEGQRVRLGRAFGRVAPRLAILDEPFRGLDRETRRRLMAEARRRWAEATLLCVTHDVGETLDFPRVWVVDGGRLVADGDPRELANREDSPYARLLQQEEETRRRWQDAGWRRLTVVDGRVVEEGTAEPSEDRPVEKGVVGSPIKEEPL